MQRYHLLFHSSSNYGLTRSGCDPDSASAGVAPYAVGLELADLVGANYLCAFDRSDYKGKIMISK